MIVPVTVSVFMAMACPTTKLAGFNKPMNKQEIQLFSQAKKRCKEIYPEAPCLKRFEKHGEQNFWAICGKAK